MSRLVYSESTKSTQHQKVAGGWGGQLHITAYGFRMGCHKGLLKVYCVGVPMLLLCSVDQVQILTHRSSAQHQSFVDLDNRTASLRANELQEDSLSRAGIQDVPSEHFYCVDHHGDVPTFIHIF